MPRQQTQSRAPKDPGARKPQPQRSPKGRGLDALSRAEEQIPTKLGVRRNRLGDYDDGQYRKRHTGGDDDDEDEDNEERPHYKRRRTDASDEGGSDSEGHEWKLGQVDSDDDESLDSDEALGSSDEERFEGFTFRGSSSNKSKQKKTDRKKRPEISLSEDVDESEEEASDDDDDDDDEDDEDGIDLLTAWDMNTAAEEKAAQKAADKARRAADGEDSDEDSGSDGDSEDDPTDDDTDLSISDDDADAQKSGLSKLQDFVQSMGADRSRKPKQRSQEQGAPTEYGLTSSRKLTVADLLPSITDSRLKSSLKHVDAAPQVTKSGVPGKLDAPLAKRQQRVLFFRRVMARFSTGGFSSRG